VAGPHAGCSDTGNPYIVVLQLSKVQGRQSVVVVSRASMAFKKSFKHGCLKY
jgi:hypothetical protein